MVVHLASVAASPDVNIVSIAGNAIGGSTLPVSGTVAVSGLTGTVDVDIVAQSAGDITIADGGNSITVDGTVAVSGDVEVVQPTHDDLNCNANVQQGNSDVATGNALFVQPGTGAAFPVTDDGGSLTVDGTVAVSSVGGTVTIQEPLSVDDNGGSLTVDGTVSLSSAVTEDAAVPANPTLIPPGAERDDTLGTLGEADGDWVHLRTNNRGALWVQQDGTITLASVRIENAAVSPGHPVFPMGVVRDDALGTLGVADNDWTEMRVSSRGALWVTYDGTQAVSISSVTPGTAATNLGKAEDAAHTTGDVGVMALAVRNDAGTALATTTGDYIPITTDSVGRVRSLAQTNLLEDAAAGTGYIVFPAGVIRDDALATLTPADGDWTAPRTNSRGATWVQRDTVRTITSLFSAEEYDDVTATSSSSSVDVSTAQKAMVYIDLEESGSPTDIRLIAQFSPDSGSTWHDWAIDQWVDLRYVEAQMPITEVIPLNFTIGGLFRLTAVATGTTASDTITLTASIEMVAS